MWSTAEVDVLVVALLAALLAMAAASPRRRRHFYDAEYEDYYPTLFRHDHRDFFVNVDHRYIYCDCRFFSNILTMRYVQYVQ